MAIMIFQQALVDAKVRFLDSRTKLVLPKCEIGNFYETPFLRRRMRSRTRGMHE